MTPAEMELVLDARYEASWELDEPEPDMTCGECGYRWAQGWIGGCGLDPGEPRHPDCPRCGGSHA